MAARKQGTAKKSAKAKKRRKLKGAPAGDAPIIVAVDFSDDSRAALAWACEASVGMRAPLLVLHVVHDPAESPGYYRKDIKDLMRPMEDVAEKMMRKFINSARDAKIPKKPLRSLKTKLVKGLPVTRIIEVAGKVNARMIVMGSQGRTGLRHLLLGSKAEQVAQLSPIPVTIVKTGKK